MVLPAVLLGEEHKKEDTQLSRIECNIKYNADTVQPENILFEVSRKSIINKYRVPNFEVMYILY